MITGMMHENEPRIRLRLLGPGGRRQTVDAIVDTGYTDALTLPPAMIAELGLRFRSIDRCILADGSECLFDVYQGAVIWDRKMRRILIDEADTEPLVGIGLLKGFEFNMQVRPRGKVTIRRLLD